MNECKLFFKGQCKTGFELEELNELYPTQLDTLVSTRDILMLAANVSSGQSISMLPNRDMMDHFPSPSKAHAKKREWSLLISGIWSLPSNEDVIGTHIMMSRETTAPPGGQGGGHSLTVGPVWLWSCLMFGWIRSLSSARISPHTLLTEAELLRGRSIGNRPLVLFHTLGN